MDGKTVARRSTRAFTEDCGPLNGEVVSGDSIIHSRLSSNADSQDRLLEKQRPGRSRSSSTSSTKVAACRADFGGGLDGSIQDISSGVSTPAEDSRLGKQKKIPGYPVNFGLIIPGVYRSGYPETEDHEYLGTLGLRTILTLVEKDFPKGYKTFMQTNGIKHILINMEGTKKVPISALTMVSIMEVVLDRRNYPMLVHCNHGKHRTGCVAAVVRKVMGWTIELTIQEYRLFADPKARDVDIEYITTFNVDTLSYLINSLRRRDNAPRGLPPCLQTSSKIARMVRMLLFTGFALCIWAYTFTNWQV